MRERAPTGARLGARHPPTVRRWAALLLLVSWAGLSPGGEGRLTGRVVDASSGKPLPFASLGVTSAGVGTVADEEGRFRLELPAGSNGPLTVSAVGYQTRKIPLAELDDGDVPLVPLELVVRERVTVVADADGDEVVLGKVYAKRGFKVGFGSGQLGTQIGAHIRVDRPTRIESAHFVVDHTGGERFLYRVNLYDFADGEVGQNWLRENVLVEAPQRRGPIDVDLSRHRIVVERDVLLCLEWVRADPEDGDGGNANVMFRARRRGSSLYMRMTSHAPFRPIGSLGLGFYLSGRLAAPVAK